MQIKSILYALVDKFFQCFIIITWRADPSGKKFMFWKPEKKCSAKPSYVCPLCAVALRILEAGCAFLLEPMQVSWATMKWNIQRLRFAHKKWTPGPQNTLSTCWASQVGKGWDSPAHTAGSWRKASPMQSCSCCLLHWLGRRCEAGKGDTDHVPSRWEWTLSAWQLCRGKAGRQCPVAPANSCRTAEAVLESVWAMDFLSPAYMNSPMVFRSLCLPELDIPEENSKLPLGNCSSRLAEVHVGKFLVLFVNKIRGGWFWTAETQMYICREILLWLQRSRLLRNFTCLSSLILKQ